MRARGWQGVLGHWLVSTPSAPATATPPPRPDTAFYALESSENFFIEALELGASQPQQVLDKEK